MGTTQGGCCHSEPREAKFLITGQLRGSGGQILSQARLSIWVKHRFQELQIGCRLKFPNIGMLFVWLLYLKIWMLLERAFILQPSLIPVVLQMAFRTHLFYLPVCLPWAFELTSTSQINISYLPFCQYSSCPDVWYFRLSRLTFSFPTLRITVLLSLCLGFEVSFFLAFSNTCCHLGLYLIV